MSETTTAAVLNYRMLVHVKSKRPIAQSMWMRAIRHIQLEVQAKNSDGLEIQVAYFHPPEHTFGTPRDSVILLLATNRPCMFGTSTRKAFGAELLRFVPGFELAVFVDVASQHKAIHEVDGVPMLPVFTNGELGDAYIWSPLRDEPEEGSPPKTEPPTDDVYAKWRENQKAKESVRDLAGAVENITRFNAEYAEQVEKARNAAAIDNARAELGEKRSVLDELVANARAEKASEPNGEMPPYLDTPAFREAWALWCDYRRQSKQPLSKEAAVMQMRRLAEWGEDKAILSIMASINRGWKGLFEPDISPAPSSDSEHIAACEDQGPNAEHVPIHPALDTPEFRETFERWKEHRKKLNYRFADSAESYFSLFAEMGLEMAVGAMNRSIERGSPYVSVPGEWFTKHVPLSEATSNVKGDDQKVMIWDVPPAERKGEFRIALIQTVENRFQCRVIAVSERLCLADAMERFADGSMQILTGPLGSCQAAVIVPHTIQYGDTVEPR